MVYTFQLWKHPNIFYREAIRKLSICELFCMLRSLSVEADIHSEIIGSAPFLTFECHPLSEAELIWLRGHSCVVFMAEKKGDALVPVPVLPRNSLSEELPEVLKYKGKTSPAFMRMMYNTALSLTPYARSSSPVTALDPLCGRGTGLFCALLAGANAAGMDQDGRDLKEAESYFSRFLKMHRIKHSLEHHSETVLNRAVPVRVFQFSPSKEGFREGQKQSLSLYEGDTELIGSLLKKKPAHVLIADLPYGIQHAPLGGKQPESFDALLARAFPAWKKALLPGAAIGISFNKLTLKPDRVCDPLSRAGFQPLQSAVFSGLDHSVEQAVLRDLIFATVPQHPRFKEDYQ